MMKFKTFKAGEYTDEDIADFQNTYIVMSDKYLENGTIYFYYREVSDLGVDKIDLITRLDKSITAAQTEVFDAQQGTQESEEALEEIHAKIADTSPNDKEQWDSLQAERKFHEDQIILNKGTVETRTRQADALKAAALELNESAKG